MVAVHLQSGIGWEPQSRTCSLQRRARIDGHLSGLRVNKQRQSLTAVFHDWRTQHASCADPCERGSNQPMTKSSLPHVECPAVLQRCCRLGDGSSATRCRGATCLGPLVVQCRWQPSRPTHIQDLGLDLAKQPTIQAGCRLRQQQCGQPRLQCVEHCGLPSVRWHWCLRPDDPHHAGVDASGAQPHRWVRCYPANVLLHHA